jgi:hypothetical protein
MNSAWKSTDDTNPTTIDVSMSSSNSLVNMDATTCDPDTDSTTDIVMEEIISNQPSAGNIRKIPSPHQFCVRSAPIKVSLYDASEKQQLPEKNSTKSKRAFEPGEDGHNHFKINHYRKIAMEAISYYLSRKVFDQKVVERGGGGGLKCCSPEIFLRIDFFGKILPLPPSPQKKHGTH